MEKKTAAQIEAEKKQRAIEIKAAEDAYNAFELKGPEDVKKSFELQKALFELKGADEVKNFEEKMAAINETLEAAKTAKDDEIKALRADLDITIKAFDQLQVRIGKDRSVKNAPAEVKSFSQHVKEELELKGDEVAKFVKGEVTKLQLEIKGGNAPVEQKAVADVSTANVTGGSVWGAIYRPGIITNPNQINHIRNFIPTYPAGPGTDFYFMKENGVGEGAPAPTAEKQAAAATNPATGLKPSFDVDLVEASVKFETIAGIMIASKKALNNIPNFMQFLNMRVPEKLLDVEDAQILYGDGNTPNIKGILTSGNFTASTSLATTLAEAIIDDLALLEDTYKRIATGIFMRPAPLLEFFKAKASGSGEFDLPRNFVFVGSQLYISGVPVYKTTALTVGDYFIESRDGVELYIQEGIRMEFFNQHASLAATNQIMVRIEETIALPVYGATYRIKGTVPEGS
jgi:HK97 family phage major capsid protein